MRIYQNNSDGGNEELILEEVVNTYFLTDWHTLTYMCLEEGGEHMAVVSENGYLFIWNVLTKKMIYSRKIHSGSIEALAWRGNKLVCCSSDCTYSIISIAY